MNFYKIMNQDECHYNMKYKTGLNIDCNPFNPSCEPMGIYFSSEDIFAFLDFYSYWIREVIIPEDAQIQEVIIPEDAQIQEDDQIQTFENLELLKKWKANKIILGKRKKINVTTLRELLDEGANPHNIALHWFSNRGDIDSVKLLIERGADINSNHNRALWWAAEKNHIDIVKFLIPLSNSRIDCGYALIQAIKHNHKEIIDVLRPVSDV